MSVLIVTTDREHVDSLLSSAMTVVNAKEQQQVTVLCWTYSPTVKYPLLADESKSAENDALVQQTQQVLGDIAQSEDEGVDA